MDFNQFKRNFKIDTAKIPRFYLKVGMLNNFDGIGPENKLFSMFLQNKNVTKL